MAKIPVLDMADGKAKLAAKICVKLFFNGHDVTAREMMEFFNTTRENADAVIRECQLKFIKACERKGI